MSMGLKALLGAAAAAILLVAVAMLLGRGSQHMVQNGGETAGIEDPYATGEGLPESATDLPGGGVPDTPGLDQIVGELALVTVAPQRFAYVSGVAPQDPQAGHAALIGALERVRAELEAREMAPIGPPMSVTAVWDEDQWAFDAGYPIAEPVEVPTAGQIKIGDTYGGEAVKGLYAGPLDGIAPLYNAIDAYMDANELMPAGGPREVYITGAPEDRGADQLIAVYFPAAPLEE